MTEIIGKNSAQFISDIVGKAYEKWRRGAVVKITAPTGSGKSYFILHTLLAYAIENELKILYLVNRKILKEQLESELKYNIQYELRDELKDKFRREVRILDYIKIETYQNIEKYLKAGTMIKAKDYYYVVYDECHYFYSDSLFNTTTELSYDFLRKTFYGSVEIFMSATMKYMQKKIDEREAVSTKSLENVGVVNVNEAFENASSSKEDFYNFTVPINYDYVKLHIFEDDNNLLDIVTQSRSKKKKWLIFVDHIPRGKELEKKLITQSTAGYSKEDIVFIDARYEQDADASRAVEELSCDKMIKKSVIITTAVMDNGISFHDGELRNIVIMADTEEEFIQMLGRKRRDGKNINLFICKRDSNYFLRRKRNVEGALAFYNRYRNDIDGMYWKLWDRQYLSEAEKKHRGIKELENGSIFQKFTPQQCVSEPGIMQCVTYRICQQQKMLNSMIEDIYAYENIRKFCYFVNGIAAFNTFSIDRLYDLRHFYSEMEQKLQEDKFAFVKCQAEWLSFSEEEVEGSIGAFCADLKEKCKVVIKEVLEEVLNEEQQITLNKKMCEALKKDEERNITQTPFFEAMINLYELCYRPECGMESLEEFKKNERGFKEDSFNTCIELVNLPYRMTKPKKGTYIIERISE